MDWMQIAERSLAGMAPTNEESMAILAAPDEEMPAIVAAASRLRRRYFGNTVKINFLVNIKSGICPEDCHYCSQSKLSKATIDKYNLLSSNEIIDSGARIAAVACPFCTIMVSDGVKDAGAGEKVQVLDLAEVVARSLKRKAEIAAAASPTDGTAPAPA